MRDALTSWATSRQVPQPPQPCTHCSGSAPHNWESKCSGNDFSLNGHPRAAPMWLLVLSIIIRQKSPSEDCSDTARCSAATQQNKSRQQACQVLDGGCSMRTGREANSTGAQPERVGAPCAHCRVCAPRSHPDSWSAAGRGACRGRCARHARRCCDSRTATPPGPAAAA